MSLWGWYILVSTFAAVYFWYKAWDATWEGKERRDEQGWNIPDEPEG